MTFTKDSQIAKSYAILIFAGVGKYKSIEDVPNAGNLREIVAKLLEEMVA